VYVNIALKDMGSTKQQDYVKYLRFRTVIILLLITVVSVIKGMHCLMIKSHAS